MRETGLIVVSTEGGSINRLFQLSLQERRLIQREVDPSCKHEGVHLLCVQIAGNDYLALSCCKCRNIKLMDFKRQLAVFEGSGTVQSSSNPKKVKYEVTTAFSGENVSRMCLGNQNRIFVRTSNDILELDTSSTTFTKVNIIRSVTRFSDRYYHFSQGLCFVPGPIGLLLVSSRDEIHVLSYDDNETEWFVKRRNMYPGCCLYMPSSNAVLVADRYKNRGIVLSTSSQKRQYLQLPDEIYNIRGLGWFKNQVIIASGDAVKGKQRISFFSPK